MPLWTHALLSPYIQAIHLSLVRQRIAGPGDSTTQAEYSLRERLLREGPQALKPVEKMQLLWDADAVFWLHNQLWSRADRELHPIWLKLQADCGASPLLSEYVMAR